MFTIRLPLHAGDQPRAGGAHRRGVLRAAAADRGRRAAPVQGRGRRRTSGRDAAAFDYGGQKYRFQHLATFVGLEPSPLPEQDVTIPVVLVRAGEHSTGLVADELVGSREIVVKSVGPQISGIRGISGATILGDGRIVIILDIGALVRAEWRGARRSRRRRRARRATARTFAHGGGRLDHRAPRDAAPAGAQRHARADRARRHGRGGAAAGQRPGHHPARHRDAAHGRLRGRRARAQRPAPEGRADHHDHLARRREAPRARHRARRRRLPRQALPGGAAARCDRAAGRAPPRGAGAAHCRRARQAEGTEPWPSASPRSTAC